VDKIKITIRTKKAASVNTQKTVLAGINTTKDNQDDVVDKISNLLNVGRRKLGNERCSIENC